MMGVSPPASSGNGSKTVRLDSEVGTPLRDVGGRALADAEEEEEEDEDDDGAAAPFLRAGSRLNTKSSSDSSASAVVE